MSETRAGEATSMMEIWVSVLGSRFGFQEWGQVWWVIAGVEACDGSMYGGGGYSVHLFYTP